MSDSVMPSVAVRPRRGWLQVATIGVALSTLAMLTIALTMLDKPHEWLVGTWFLPIISSGMMVGGLVLIVAALMLPERKTWRGIALILWGLIALTSPWFGWVFLFPWALLALTLPLVIVILRRFSHARRSLSS
jgi:hypothetical protein